MSQPAAAPPERFVAFDTETTGTDKKARLVSVAWNVYDGDGQLLESHLHVVRPYGYTIPAETTRIHGYTTERATAEGKPLVEVLTLLCETVSEYPDATFVAHNASFDYRMVEAEAARAKLWTFRKLWMRLKPEGRLFCTLRTYETPGPKGHNTLAAMYQRCTGQAMKDAHTADADTAACAAIFFHHRPKRQAAAAAPSTSTSKRKREAADEAADEAPAPKTTRAAM